MSNSDTPKVDTEAAHKKAPTADNEPAFTLSTYRWAIRTTFAVLLCRVFSLGLADTLAHGTGTPAEWSLSCLYIILGVFFLFLTVLYGLQAIRALVIEIYADCYKKKQELDTEAADKKARQDQLVASSAAAQTANFDD
jgi:hypothetical protein